MVVEQGITGLIMRLLVEHQITSTDGFTTILAFDTILVLSQIHTVGQFALGLKTRCQDEFT